MVFTLKPAYGDNFIGRKPELDLVLKNLTSRKPKNCIIFGNKRTGKTSLLLTLKSLTKTPTIFLQLNFNISSTNEFIKQLFIEILNQYEKYLNISPEDILSASVVDIDNLLAESKLGKELREKIKILAVFDQEKNPDLDIAVNALFTLPESLALETKKKCILLFDDFENILKLKTLTKTVAEHFSNTIQICRHTSFAISSSSKDIAVNFPDKLPLEIIKLNNFNIGHTSDLYNNNLKSINSSSIKLIHKFCGGYPFYLNFMGRYMERQSANYTEERVKSLLTDFLDNECNILFNESLAKLSSKERLILFCMAIHDVNTPSKISKIIDYSQTNVRRFLSIMESKGFVENHERGVFEIIDPVLVRWIKHSMSNNIHENK